MTSNLHDIKEPFWYHTGSWDIPATMIGMLRSLSHTNCKKVTIVQEHGKAGIDEIQKAADQFNIELDWIPMPNLENMECEVKL